MSLHHLQFAMKKFLTLIFCVQVFSVSAQKIEGKVYDENGKILPFASILIKGTTKGVTANNEGDFIFNLPPGNYTLVCRYVGYTTQEKIVNLSSTNISVNFNLKIQKLLLKEVVIEQGGEDPAYEIIRQAIKKRPFYEKQIKAYQAEVYIKGIVKLRKKKQ